MSLMCTGLCLHPGHPDGQIFLWAESTTARLLYSNAARGEKGQGDVFIGCNWKLHGKKKLLTILEIFQVFEPLGYKFVKLSVTFKA